MIKVVGAIIINQGKLMAARRSYGKLSGKYEFPSGKIEGSENDQSALIREIEEELGVNSIVYHKFMETIYYYEDIDITVSLVTYFVEVSSLAFILNSHIKLNG